MTPGSVDAEGPGPSDNAASRQQSIQHDHESHHTQREHGSRPARTESDVQHLALYRALKGDETADPSQDEAVLNADYHAKQQLYIDRKKEDTYLRNAERRIGATSSSKKLLVVAPPPSHHGSRAHDNLPLSALPTLTEAPSGKAWTDEQAAGKLDGLGSVQAEDASAATKAEAAEKPAGKHDGEDRKRVVFYAAAEDELSLSAASDKKADGAAGDDATAAADATDQPLRPPNRFVAWFRWLVTHEDFELAVVLAITMNTVTLACYNPLPGNDDWNNTLDTIDLVLNIIFTVELGIRMIAAESPMYYLKQPWNLFDLFMVAAGYTVLLPAGTGSSGLEAVRALRALRPLRMITRFESLRAILACFFEAVPLLVSVVAMLSSFMFVFSVVGTEIFMGMYNNQCIAPDGTFEQAWTDPDEDGCGSRVCPQPYSCVTLPYSTAQNIAGFNNVALGIYSVFQTITVSGYSFSMYRSMDFLGWPACFFWMCCVVMGSYGVLNLFLAVLKCKFSKAQSVYAKHHAHDEARPKNSLAKLVSYLATKLMTWAEHMSETTYMAIQLRTIHVLKERAAAVAKPAAEDPPADDAASDGNSHEASGSVSIKSAASIAAAQPAPAAATDSKAAATAATASKSAANAWKHASASSKARGARSGKPRVVRMSTRSRGLSAGPVMIAPVVAIAELPLLSTLPDAHNLSIQDFDSFLSSAPRAQRRWLAWQFRLRKFVDSTHFAHFFLACIVANTLALCIDHDGETQATSTILADINTFFTVMFTVELSVKVLAMGPWEYAFEHWNKFDCLVVALSLMELGLGTASGVSGLRAVRTLRVLKLFRYLESLAQIFAVMVKAMEAAFAIFMLVILFWVVYSIVGLHTLGGLGIPFPNCDTFVNAMVMNFNTLNLENWQNNAFPHIRATSYATALYFITWIIIGKFVFLSLFLAIVLDAFNDTAEEQAREAAELEAKMAKAKKPKRLGAVVDMARKMSAMLKSIGPKSAGQSRRETKITTDSLDSSFHGSASINHRTALSRLSSINVRKFTRSSLSRKERADADVALAGLEPSVGNMSQDGGSHDGAVRPSAGNAVHFADGPLSTFNQVTEERKLFAHEQLNYDWNEYDSTLQAINSTNSMDGLNSGSHAQHAEGAVPLPGAITAEPSERARVTGDVRAAPTWPGLMGEDSDAGLGGLGAHGVAAVSLAAKSLRAKGEAGAMDRLPAPKHATWQAMLAKVNAAKAAEREASPSHGSVTPDSAFTRANTMDYDRQRTMSGTSSIGTVHSVAQPLEGKSLWLFAPDNLFRMHVYDIATARWFDTFMILVILANCILMAFESPLLSKTSTLYAVLNISDIVFTIIFGVEALIKIVAFGFKPYIRRWNNQLDLFIVFISALLIGLDTTNVSFLKGLRVLRAMKPLRTLTRNKGMQLVFKAVTYSLASMANLTLLCLLCLLIFAIMGVQLFGGKFYSCNDSTVPDQASCVGQYVDPDTGLVTDRQWSDPDFNFDTVGNAMICLFVISTMNGYTPIMESAMEAPPTKGLQPVPNVNWPAFIFFAAYIVLIAYSMLTLYIGVIFYQFSRIKLQSSKGSFILTDGQKEWVELCKILFRMRPPQSTPCPKNPKRRLVYNFVQHRYFENAIIIVIVCNCLMMATATYGMEAAEITITNEITYAFTAVYVGEMVLKLIGMGKFYWKYTWNRFDAALVLAAVVDVVVTATVTSSSVSNVLHIQKLLRLLRLLRLIRVARGFKGVRTLFETLIVSLPAFGNVGALLFLFFYVYAYIGVMLFGEIIFNKGVDEHANFQYFWTALLTLFKLGTTDNWTDLFRGCQVQPPDCDPNLGNCGTPIAIPYFISFYILVTIILLNLLTAVIIENFETQQEQEDWRLHPRVLEHFVDLWAEYDELGNGYITPLQLENLLRRLEPPLGLGIYAEPADVLSFVLELDIPVVNMQVPFHRTLYELVRRCSGTEIPEGMLRDEVDALLSANFKRLGRDYMNFSVAVIVMRMARKWRARTLGMKFLRKREQRVARLGAPDFDEVAAQRDQLLRELLPLMQPEGEARWRPSAAHKDLWAALLAAGQEEPGPREGRQRATLHTHDD